jgi:hypothetical protein
MNEHPYPLGRWTTVKTESSARLVASPSEARAPSLPEAGASLRSSPLRDLFWGPPESQLLEEARRRVEQALASALAREPKATGLMPREFGWPLEA